MTSVMWGPLMGCAGCAAPLVSVTSLDGANLAKSVSSPVTISGLNFVSSSSTPTSSLTTMDVCGSTAWTSVTTVSCVPQAYTGAALRTSVVVGGVSSTRGSYFSFDGIQRIGAARPSVAGALAKGCARSSSG